MTDPTVRHATRHSSPTADLEVWVTSQATWSSKSLVWPAPGRAHGTWATVGPRSGQFVHPRSVGLNVTGQHAEVHGPPVASPHPLVIARGATPTAPTMALLRAPGPDVDDDGIRLLVEVDRLDDRLPVDTEQFAP